MFLQSLQGVFHQTVHLHDCHREGRLSEQNGETIKTIFNTISLRAQFYFSYFVNPCQILQILRVVFHRVFMNHLHDA